MITSSDVLAFELMSSAEGVLKSVTLDCRHDRWIVYTSITVDESRSPGEALGEAEIILRRVLQARLTDKNWIAAVLLGDRISRTIRPMDLDRVANQRTSL